MKIIDNMEFYAHGFVLLVVVVLIILVLQIMLWVQVNKLKTETAVLAQIESPIGFNNVRPYGGAGYDLDYYRGNGRLFNRGYWSRRHHSRRSHHRSRRSRCTSRPHSIRVSIRRKRNTDC